MEEVEIASSGKSLLGVMEARVVSLPAIHGVVPSVVEYISPLVSATKATFAVLFRNSSPSGNRSWNCKSTAVLSDTCTCKR